MTKNLKRDERTELIEQSLKAVSLKHEQSKTLPVKLSHLNEAASRVAVEYADFETPWEQSLKLMVEAAGVQLSGKSYGIEENEPVTPAVVATVNSFVFTFSNLPLFSDVVSPILLLLGFQVLGFQVLGFQVLGFQVLEWK